MEGGGVLFLLLRREMKPEMISETCALKDSMGEKRKYLSKIIAVFMMIVDMTVGVKHTLSTPQSMRK